MSGRAYARNPSGGFGGATDIHSFVPHRFRLAAPKVTNALKDQAIRRAIQRRCKEKNWKKLLHMQHTRLFPLQTEEEEAFAAGNGVQNGGNDAEKTSTDQQNGVVNNGSAATSGAVKETADAAGGESSTADAAKDGAETPVVAVVDAKQQEKEALETTKRQLEEMEEKLKTLSAQKHDKFQQLKDLLIAEARSKSTPPMPKKRRVDSLGSSSGTGNSPRLTGASLAEGMSLLGAPSPSLLRAQSFSVSSSREFPAPDPEAKDTRRQ